MKIGYALSSGVIKGAAHVGVIKVLEKYGIKPDLIAGASSGAMAASCYAMGYTVQELEDMVLDFTDYANIDYFGIIKGILNPKKKIQGLSTGNKLEDTMKKFLGDSTFFDTKIPLAITATEINKAVQVIFSSLNRLKFEEDDIVINDAKIYEAVRASASMPFIYDPKLINYKGEELKLVDGGVLEKLPIETVKKMGADKIIAVNLSYQGKYAPKTDSALEYLWQASEIMAYEITRLRTEEFVKYSYIISPDLSDINGFDSKSIKKCIQRGEEATEKSIHEIISFLRN